MSQFLFTTEARDDLDEIWQYIARDSVHYADLVEEAILSTCRLAAENPGIGRRRAELSQRNILFVTVSGYDRYLVAYLGGSDPLRIVGVIHGARNVRHLAPRLV